jgi:hypothetical protein
VTAESVINKNPLALQVSAERIVTCLFKKRLLNIILLFNKYKSMFVIFINNNKLIFINIRVVSDLLGCFILSNKIIKGTK